MLVLMLTPIRSMPAAIVALCCASAPLIADSAPPVTPSHFNDQGPAMTHVRVEMGLDRSAIPPGGGATIGVRFVIEDGWHLYWRNNGDSGLPIGVTFEAPEGVRIGPIQWPAPERPVAIVPLGAEAEAEALGMAQRLRRAGFPVDLGFSGNLKKRLDKANKANAAAAVIIGDDELAKGVAAVRDMETGEQTEVPFSSLEEHLARYR